MDKLNIEKSQGLDNKKNTVRRILLDQDVAASTTDLINQLRKSSCKTDASKLVNTILNIFFNKYTEQEYKALVQHFFDKKNYLKKLISNTATEDIDASIKLYLERNQRGKKRGRKPKDIASKSGDESTSGS